MLNLPPGCTQIMSFYLSAAMRNFSVAIAISISIAVALLASAPFADAHGQPTAVDPQNPAAPVPSVTYRSAFEGYRSHTGEKLLPWRESNDAAVRIGGWRTYLRETQQDTLSVPEKMLAPANVPTATSPEKPAPHRH